MSESPRIGLREAIGVLTIILVAKAFLPYFVFMLHRGLTATWLVILLHLPIAVIGVLVLVWLLERHPGKTIVEIGEDLAGPVLSMIFSFTIVTYLILLVGFELRQFSEFLLTAFLTETPISVVAMAFLLAMTAVAYMGIDITARLAWLFFIPFLIGVGTLLGLTVNLWETHGLYPLLGPGVGGLARCVVTTLGVGSELVLLTIIAPFLAPKSLRPAGLVSVLVSGIIVFLIMVVVLMVYIFPVTHELTLAIFEISRAIEIGRFLVRLETLFLPLWMFAGLIAMTAGLYGAAAVTARALNMPYYRPFVFPMAVIVLAASFLFPNLSSAMQISFDLLITWSAVPIGVIIGTLVGVEFFRARKGGRNKGRRKTTKGTPGNDRS